MLQYCSYAHHYKEQFKSFFKIQSNYRVPNKYLPFNFINIYFKNSFGNQPHSIRQIRDCKMKQKTTRKPKVISKESKRGRPKKKQQKQRIVQFKFSDYFPKEPQYVKIIDLQSEGEMEVQEVHQLQDNPIFDENQLRIVRINHFFKKNDQIYFQVLLGRGQLTFRQPQILPFYVLSKDKYKKMLYNYLIKLFKSTLAN